MKPINIGLMGVGTVGGGTATVLKRNAEEISRRAGRPIRVCMAANRDVARARKFWAKAYRWWMTPCWWSTIRKSTSWSS
jgi:homoserine dehydrogenase